MHPTTTDSRAPDLGGKAALHRYPGSAFNADTPAHLLDAPLTPVSHVFVRNNGGWPDGLPDDPDAFAFRLDGHVARPLAFTLGAMKARFAPVTVTTVMECAGNGRGALDPPVEGIPWSGGAVACLRFTGVRLADLLVEAGPAPDAVYTAHHAPDRTETGAVALSRGLPLWKATAPETLLAYAMNGEPLPRIHGGPLRLVVPGFPGSAWQKWLTRIEVRDREHDGAKMTGLDYRLPDRPLAPGDPLDDAAFTIIEDMPVKSLVTHPTDGAALVCGVPVEIRGFAWSGRVPVASVALAIDNAWHETALEPAQGAFAWRRFRLAWRPERSGSTTIVARATDAAGRPQPLSPAWNPRGYCNNGCHHLAVAVT